MNVPEWIRLREMRGKVCFSFLDIKGAFPDSTEEGLLNSLSRLVREKRLSLVAKGFYCVVPPQYGLQGDIPPPYYVDQLMRHYKKPYYVCLLSAAMFWGAAHQRPQRFSIMTTAPKFQRSPQRNNMLLWFYRQSIPDRFLLDKNTETSSVKYSNAELTAIDLVQFEQHIGGLSRAATVLSELLESTNFSGASEDLFNYTTMSTIQRLGYIIEKVLEDNEQANIIYSEMMKLNKKINYCFLSNRQPKNKTNIDKRWKLFINAKIEPDDI